MEVIAGQLYRENFRGKVLAACDAGEGIRAIAVQLAISESWIRRIQQTRREGGQLAPKTAGKRQLEWLA
ncbi:helix-turn-helix domain-containing protein [Lignipirellula cremea]|uniref:helix-turn-helix domain-containing protein n=1 Tax=Lignipirellula cremea TaxID=2528010 RepID=UPI0011A419E5|nr:helix-turn-helix domain-containing protein [Lignipirellula cremea]